MEKKLQEVVELALGLPLKERAALARALLAPVDDPTEDELHVLEREMDDREQVIPYEKVRRELGLGAHSTGTKAARRS